LSWWPVSTVHGAEWRGHLSGCGYVCQARLHVCMYNGSQCIFLRFVTCIQLVSSACWPSQCCCAYRPMHSPANWWRGMQPAVLRMVLICTARPMCMMLALVHPLDSPERGSLVAFIFSMDPSDPPACMCSVRRSAVGAMPLAGRAPWCTDAAGWAIH
jgi:hypothetical protein